MCASRISLHFSAFPPGIGSAMCGRVVTGLARRLSALALVVAMVATASGSAFAQNRHSACETKHHDCDQPAKITSCCCGDPGTPRDNGTPAQSRTDVASGVAAVPLPLQFEQPMPATHAAAIAIQSSPPGLALLDLTTLFGCLLI